MQKATIAFGSVVLSFFLSSGSTNAGENVTDVQLDIPYTKFVLTNGLTLIVHEDHKAPIVAVNLWYHVGSKNEKPGKTGFAHLFEHLMYYGSEHLRGCCESLCNHHRNSRIRLKLRGMSLLLAS
jgi:zinc protease